MEHEWKDKLVVGITSTALFDLRESQKVFDDNTDDPEIYYKYTLDHENEIPQPGIGFPLVQSLLAINKGQAEGLVEVVLISKNDADTGLRVAKAIEHHKLAIECGTFTGGGPQYPFLPSFACDLFLSTDLDEVRRAHEEHVPAALVYGLPGQHNLGTDEVRIAFDGDCVLFSEETQKVYERPGEDRLARTVKYEKDREHMPLEPGPFKPFLDAVSKIQKKFAQRKLRPDKWPIQTYLVTARQLKLCTRPIMTLRDWGIRLNKSFYLGGLKKWYVLNVLRPHMFFDDQKDNLEDILGPGALVLRNGRSAPPG